MIKAYAIRTTKFKVRKELSMLRATMTNTTIKKINIFSRNIQKNIQKCTIRSTKNIVGMYIKNKSQVLLFP